MGLAPGQRPPGGGDVSGASGPAAAGAYGGEVTGQPNQYPASLFGVALPRGTGAAGTAGAGGGADPTNQPGQLSEGISGEGPSETADSGAPGSAGQPLGAAGGPDSVTYTDPGSFLAGTNTSVTVSDSVSGPADWTQAIDGSYAGGGPQLPGIRGNEPTSTGAGQGRVLRGGRAVR
jgi:hypothetical protein